MIKINEFIRAVERLQEALQQPKNEFIRDSVIKRFEFCVELSWKTGKKVMGTTTTAPRDVIRELAQGGYIQDVGIWLEAIEMRNLSSHTYKEDLAEKVFEFVVAFFPTLQDLANRLKSK